MYARKSQPVLALAIILTLSITAQARTIYVDDDAPPGGDGQSWQTAYRYLQDALTDAGATEKPGEIRIAQGVYKPNQRTNQTVGPDRFELISGVALKGGYAGLRAADPNARDIALYETILSGDLAGNDVGVDDPRDFASEPTRADNAGSIVHVYQVDGTAVLDGVTVTGGQKPSPSDGVVGGGGMIIGESDPTIMNCTFRDNWAESNGGAVFVRSGHPTFHNCVFSKNYALYGGAIRGGGDKTKLASCSFTNNAAGSAGAIAECVGLISNCLFQRNTAVKRGSALVGCNGLTRNSTFFGNSGSGGVVAAIYSDSPTLENCILWDGGNELWKDITSTITVRYSAICGGYDGTGNINRDCLFADPHNGDFHLKSQGGRWDPVSQTWMTDYVTSPCIDAGDPNALADSEGSPNGDRINMGIYGGTPEASKSYLGPPCGIIIAGDLNGDCKVDAIDLDILATHWLEADP